MPELTPEELHELSFILSQMTRDEIRQIYLSVNMPASKTDAAIAAAFSVRDKIVKVFKETLGKSEQCLP
ncbi:hypothetical protein H6F86_20890 [Phormidium sp. FACHB-592]|uniref:Uncharacterized protein n=1 Tax=Stenomitos frigidus AS-A4 TaxID=2933935 RepID=A0ABV0KEN5_9CYAN|nr:hypothetical protein [Phormidium sp. FACHB-592]MBD2076291.1 hypothetical protein [Phormidium sp. FACHB-592]